jgi:thermitase
MEHKNNADRVLTGIGRDFKLVGKSHIHPTYAWLIVSVVFGMALGIVYVANRSGQFEASYAMTPEPVMNRPAVAGKFSAGQVLVKFRNGIASPEQANFLNTRGYKVLSEIAQIGVKVIEVPEEAEAQVAAALAKNPVIEFAEQNFLGKKDAVTPNDPMYGQQWHLPKVQAPIAWDTTKGTVTIGIVDSGVSVTHPDMVGKVVDNISFIGQPAGVDQCNHGTSVASVASAATNNALGVAGVSWGSPIVSAQVLDSTCYASYSNIASGITWAADHGASVINVSIGGTQSSSAMQSAINYAWNKGVVVVASAGNDGTSITKYPAALNNVVAVSATDRYDALSTFSTYGPWVDISAPGSGDYATYGTGYGSNSGTSFSAPLVAGIVALIRSANPALTPTQAVQALLDGVDDLGAPGFDNTFGWGRVNAAKSVALAAGLPPPPVDTTAPTISLASPTSGAVLKGVATFSATVSDDVGVTKVEFIHDGSIITDIAAPYTAAWDTTTVADGSHTLQAKAYDSAGNVGQTSVISVMVSNAVVADTVAPTVTLLAPVEGSIVPKSGSLKISVSASDNVKVAEIRVYVDGKMYSSCLAVTSCATSISVRKVSAGTHTIRAEALDAAGNSSNASVTVTK